MKISIEGLEQVRRRLRDLKQGDIFEFARGYYKAYQRFVFIDSHFLTHDNRQLYFALHMNESSRSHIEMFADKEAELMTLVLGRVHNCVLQAECAWDCKSGPVEETEAEKAPE